MSVMRDRKSFDAEEVRRQIRALGARMGPPVLEPTTAIFAPLHPAPPYAGVTVARDRRYGPHERHRLDVFEPEKAEEPRPVLLFAHGGGFTGGDKQLPGQPFYDNVGVWAVRNGFVAVNMTYRLAPQHPWPSGAEDVARAVEWMRENIAGARGDPARIFLMGHSAGAVHAASYAAHPRFHGRNGHGLAGLILVSGLYDIAASTPAPVIESYFGADAALYRERSSLPQLGGVKVPVMVAIGEFETADFETQALALAGAMRTRDGRLPRFVRLHGHNHYSEIMALGLTYASDLARNVAEFVTIDCVP